MTDAGERHFLVWIRATSEVIRSINLRTAHFAEGVAHHPSIGLCRAGCWFQSDSAPHGSHAL
jgi:hypothetical protein